MHQRFPIATLLAAATMMACGGAPDREAQTQWQIASTTSSADRACWTDADCPDAQICRGARICPDGALCGPLADQPGTCVDGGCDYEGQHYPPGAVFGPCDACQCQADGTVICQDFVCLACSDDHDCPAGYFCESTCPPGGLCGPGIPPAYCMPIDSGDTDGCTPEECGPAPAMPNRLCDDGVHYSGPSGCRRGDDGICGYEILSCPDSDTDADAVAH